jgi:acyl-[acyl-carrier-protein]-phospholipid O-acyltransferase/long-chain-fatty-acid--[acyl-carrier-protein] ligase
MKGYLGRSDLTREVVHDGWYVTGDMAVLDEDGFITLTGRLARFSKIGGEMVPHQKIEEELQELIGAADRSCVVTAVPDTRRGERIVVLHTPFHGTDGRKLCQLLARKGLPNLWMPSERDFFEIPELPVLGTGKLDLKRVKEMAIDLTNGF